MHSFEAKRSQALSCKLKALLFLVVIYHAQQSRTHRQSQCCISKPLHPSGFFFHTCQLLSYIITCGYVPYSFSKSPILSPHVKVIVGHHPQLDVSKVSSRFSTNNLGLANAQSRCVKNLSRSSPGQQNKNATIPHNKVLRRSHPQLPERTAR